MKDCVLSHKEYLKLVFPFVLATITTPLMGAVDTAVVGRLYDPALLGGVAIGSVIFSTLYWLFGFLRVSTSGFAAQALGAGSDELALWALLRPLVIALGIGALFLVFQTPILDAALGLMQPSVSVTKQITIYYNILIWGAPCLLSYYVLLGWLMGMARLKAVLFVQISINLLNILLAVTFVRVCGWGVAGVASATLIAQIVSVGLTAFFVFYKNSFAWGTVSLAKLLDRQELKKIFSVNADLMLRTICLLTMTNIFTKTGSMLGENVLAANAILFQVQYLMAYIFDGFANASSVFAGKAKGARDSNVLKRTIVLSMQWGIIVSGLVAGVYWMSHVQLLALFTTMPLILNLCYEYYEWLLIFPFCAFAGLIYYGVFTGLSVTAPIRNSTILSLIVFLASNYLLVDRYGNTGLWIAFLLFSAARSVFLIPYLFSDKYCTVL